MMTRRGRTAALGYKSRAAEPVDLCLMECMPFWLVNHSQLKFHIFSFDWTRAPGTSPLLQNPHNQYWQSNHQLVAGMVGWTAGAEWPEIKINDTEYMCSVSEFRCWHLLRYSCCCCCWPTTTTTDWPPPWVRNFWSSGAAAASESLRMNPSQHFNDILSVQSTLSTTPYDPCLSAIRQSYRMSCFSSSAKIHA